MKQRGFTLAEALLGLSLVFLLLGLMSGIMTRYLKAFASFEENDRKLTAAQTAVGVMARSAREAVQFVEPLRGSAVVASALEVQVVQPYSLTCLPSTVPQPPPPTWSPHPTSELQTIRFWLDGDQLIRRTSISGQPPSEEILAEGLSGLGLRFLPSGNLEVSVSFTGRQLSTVLTEVEVQAPGRLVP